VHLVLRVLDKAVMGIQSIYKPMQSSTSLVYKQIFQEERGNKLSEILENKIPGAGSKVQCLKGIFPLRDRPQYRR